MDLTTLPAFKAYAGITDTNAARDANLSALITSASAAVENACQRVFSVTDYTLRRSGSGSVQLELPLGPVVAVDAVTISGVAVTQSPDGNDAGWVLDGTTLWLVGGLRFVRGVANVVVQFQAGYSLPPSEVQQLVNRMVLAEFKGRDWVGVSSKTLAGETITWRDEITSKSAQGILGNYRRVVPW